MNTVTIEILRNGTPHNYNLSGDIKYIALCGTHPPVEFSIDCDQYTFNQQSDFLRYDHTGEASRQEAILFFQKLLTGVFDRIPALQIEGNKSSDWLHIRLVITPKELAQLPFELALTPVGFSGAHTIPFLLNAQKPATLTREIRQVNAAAYQWPFHTRILFAWAKPNTDVPFSEHEETLYQILTPLAAPIEDNAEPVPNLALLITTIPNASLRSLQAEITSAITKEKPYTHIHILAHGITVRNRNGDQFKIALHDNDNPGKAFMASGEELARAILPGLLHSDKCPAIVSLMTCDSSNEGNMVTPSGSLAHELHQAVIPCVFASQFPLSIPGSVKLVRCLYSKLLLNGDDPRQALYFTRNEINDGNLHDWASLVAHVRFPEDIDKQLQDAKLQLLFAAMRTTNSWVDHLFKHQAALRPEKIKSIYYQVKDRLEISINNLSECLKDGCSILLTPELRCEHLGLLGSAFKRKAEHLFRMDELSNNQQPELRNQAAEALQKAKFFYEAGFNTNYSSHWNAMQYLSLKAALEGSLQADSELWTVIHFMAKKDEQLATKYKNKVWSWGTLAELYLLKPLVADEEHFQDEVAASLPIAGSYISQIRNSKIEDVIYSTAHQLDRYISWWPRMFPQSYRSALKEMATHLRNLLTG